MSERTKKEEKRFQIYRNLLNSFGLILLVNHLIKKQLKSVEDKGVQMSLIMLHMIVQFDEISKTVSALINITIKQQPDLINDFPNDVVEVYNPKDAFMKIALYLENIKEEAGNSLHCKRFLESEEVKHKIEYIIEKLKQLDTLWNSQLKPMGIR